MTTESKIELGAAQPPVKKKRGPGRPPKSTSQRVLELTRAGMPPKQIAAKLGITAQQVYTARYTDNKNKLKERQELASMWPKASVKTEGARIPYFPLKPTFWQRVKAVFFPN